MVIVCDCKYRSALAAIRSFYKCGEDIIAVTTDKEPTPPAFSSKHVKQTYVFYSDKNKYKEQLWDLCKNFQMPVIFPSGNFTLNILSEYSKEFSSVAKFLVSPPELLENLNNKKWVKLKAEEHSLNVPRLYSINDEIDFPVVVKPFCGEKFFLKPQERYKIVNNREELERAYAHFQKYSESPLIEEYIEGQGVGVSVLFDDNSDFITSFCHKRLIEYPIDGGPSAVLETFYDEKLVESVKNFFKSLNFCGIAMAEFKKTQRGFYLLEVNPRIWGSFPATLKADSDYIKSYVSVLNGKNAKTSNQYKKKKIKFFRGTCMAALSYIKKGSLLNFIKVVFVILNPFIPDAIFSFSDFTASVKDLFRR